MRVSLSRILLQAMALLNPPPLGLNPDQSLCFASAARTVPTGMSFSTSPLKFKGAGLWLVHRIAGLPRHHYLVLPCPEDASGEARLPVACCGSYHVAIACGSQGRRVRSDARANAPLSCHVSWIIPGAPPSHQGGAHCRNYWASAPYSAFQ
jgi:hypothetical protein